MDSSENIFDILIKDGILKNKDLSFAYKYLNDNNLNIRLVNLNDKEELLIAIDDIMVEGEPISKALKFKKILLSQTISNYIFIRKLIKDQLTLGIFDKNNKIVALSLAHDILTEFELDETIVEGIHDMENFLQELSNDFEQSEKWIRGQVLHLYFLGVKKEHVGHHLASVLLQELAKLSKKLKYQTIATEATNHLTVKAFQSVFCKTIIWKEMEYKTYQSKNQERPFETIDGNAVFIEAKLNN